MRLLTLRGQNVVIMQVVHMLLDEGACLNAIDTDGCTPLHLAAQDGHERIVRLLLRNGVIIDAMDRQGRTAEDLAREHGHARVIASIEAFQRQVCSDVLPFSSHYDNLEVSRSQRVLS